MSKKLLYLIVLVLAVTGTATGDQWDITVPDANFDDHVLDQYGWIYISDRQYTGAWKSDPEDWAWIGYDYYYNDPPGDLNALSGNNICYTEGGYIYQILDETFIEGGTYTLSVWAGEAWTGYPVGWWLYFTGEDYTNNLAEAIGSAPIGYWQQFSLSYTATAADAFKKIGIKMRGAGYVSFENVTLSYDGPPPPPIATNPVPADGAEHKEDYVYLFWTASAVAAEHDVYFGTSFNDVNDATASEPPLDPYKGRQTDISYYVDVLVPGTTYYWRIDEVEAGGTIHKGLVWSFWLAPWEPTNPIPPDGAMYMDPNIDLSWNSGFAASTHEVFFGTDPCALPSVSKFSGDPNYDPGTLLKDTTYYWQVKEYYKGLRTLGPIWSFSTTLPTMGTCLYEYWDGITPTGTSLSLLYNWPDFPGNPTGTQELTLFEGPTNRADQFGARIQAWLYPPVTGDYKFWIATDDNGELRLSTDENPANKQLISWVSDWTTPRDWDDTDVTPSGLIPLVAGRKYYIEALMKEGGGSDNIAVGWTTPFDDTIQVITGNYLERFVQFWAWDPSPADGAPEVPRSITLRWRPGAHAAQHQVYFGTSEASMTLKDTLAVGNEEYNPPGTLDVGQTYCWKVNEVNMAEEPNTWEGDVWNFKTAEYLLVDDMEDYDDRMAIITVWRDGYTGGPLGNSGSNVTVSTESDGRDLRLAGDGPPWPVRDSEAMQFAYDNDGGITIYIPGWLPYSYSVDANYYSEAKANPLNLPIGSKDWSEVRAMSLWFYGDAGNDIEPMWVKLTDQGGSSGKVTYGDNGENPDDINEPSWHEWNIALSDFGVNLADVNNISIGFGDESNRTTPGGSGVVFFDDIRLYPTRCILSLRSPDFARVDYVEDCVVDYKELELMVGDWLVEATDPGTGNLVGWWKLDETTGASTAQDSSAYGNHGTLIAMDPASDWGTGRIGGALHFDGIDDYVDCGDTPSLQITGTAISLAAWVKWDTAEAYSAIAMKTSNGDWADGYGLYTDTGPVSVNFYVSDYGFVATKSFAADGQWHHVVGTYDGSNVRIWVDGVEGTPISYTGSISNAVHSFEIGRGADNAYNFSGAVDDVRLYNNLVLTDSDILGLLGMRPDTYEDLKINFKDYSLIASKFLEEEMFP